MSNKLRDLAVDRIQVNSVLIVLCFVAVLLLGSQSAASYPTYLLALAMVLRLDQWNDVFRVRMFWMILLLIAFLVCSSLWSEPFVWRDVVSVATRGLLTLLFVVAFGECQLRGQVRRWLGRAMAVVGLIATLAAIVNFVVTDPVDGRLNGLGQLDTHVIAALVFGVAMVFVLDILLRERAVAWRLLAFSGLVAMVVAVVLSDSRNAWVSVFIGCGVFLLAHGVKDRQKFMAGSAAMAVAGAAIIGVLWANESTRELLLPRGLSFRPAIWSDVLARILEQGFWFGLGINTDDSVVIGEMTFLHPHSMYLSVLFQGGLVGLVAFGLLTSWTVAVLLHHYHAEEAKLALGVLAIALPAYLLDGHELLDKVGSTWFLYWLPVAIALGFAWQHRTRGRDFGARSLVSGG